MDLLSHTLIGFQWFYPASPPPPPPTTNHHQYQHQQQQPTTNHQPTTTTNQHHQLPWGIPDLELTRPSPIPQVGHLRRCSLTKSLGMTTLPPIISVKNGMSPIVPFKYSTAILHSHDYGRKCKTGGLFFFSVSSHFGLFFLVRLILKKSFC